METEVLQVPVFSADFAAATAESPDHDSHKRKDAAGDEVDTVEMDPSPKKNRKAEAAADDTMTAAETSDEPIVEAKWALHPALQEALEPFIRKRLEAKPMFLEPKRNGMFYREHMDSCTLRVTLPLEVLAQGYKLLWHRISNYMIQRMQGPVLSYWHHRTEVEIVDLHTRKQQLVLTLRVAAWLHRNPKIVAF
jgi:hypothetical protein